MAIQDQTCFLSSHILGYSRFPFWTHEAFHSQEPHQQSIAFWKINKPLGSSKFDFLLLTTFPCDKTVRGTKITVC